jgi:hypothetical protein
LDGGSARRKAATYTQDGTNTEQTHTDIHASSGVRTHDPSVRGGKVIHAADRAASEIGAEFYLRDQINGNAIVWTCSIHGGDQKYHGTKFWSGNLKEEHLGDLRLEGLKVKVVPVLN